MLGRGRLLRPSRRRLSSALPPSAPLAPLPSRPVLVTTPVFYVNGAPHIGHLYSALLADALSRWYALRGAEVKLVTGTDEHGLKVQQAAEAAGQGAPEFCAAVSAEFRALFDEAGVGYDDFVRTTEARHGAAVAALWERLADAGQLRLGSHEGWYCVADEAFVPESQLALAEDGTRVSAESGRPVEWLSERNYTFDFGAQREGVARWLQSQVAEGGGAGRVAPASLNAFALKSAGSTPAKISVSRPSQRVRWGVPVPGDEEHTVYVWLDALANYLTAAGFPWPPGEQPAEWPPTHQIVGKDILRFHAVYWPAFLLASGLEPPERISAHAHWTVDKSKMSKTAGNIVDPVAALRHYGVDGLRYFLLKEGSLRKDSDFSHANVAAVCNADLADTLGNLLLRATAPKLLPSQRVPHAPPADGVRAASAADLALLASVAALPAQVDALYRDLNMAAALDAIGVVLRATNAHFQAAEPWRLRKSEPERAEAVLFSALESVRVCALLLQPAVPLAAGRLLDMLGVPDEDAHRGAHAMQLGHGAGRALGAPTVLFEKLEPLE